MFTLGIPKAQYRRATNTLSHDRSGPIEYETLKQMGYDGRNLKHKKWIEQKQFRVGYHYNMPFEHAEQCIKLLDEYKKKESHLPHMVNYPDCRSLKIKG